MKPNYNYTPKYESSNLESKLSPQQKVKYEKLKEILDPSKFYKNCMYCGRIYEGDYEKVIFKNGKGPLTREFNDYNISTGVGPCCQDQYQKQLDEIRKYRNQ